MPLCTIIRVPIHSNTDDGIKNKEKPSEEHPRPVFFSLYKVCHRIATDKYRLLLKNLLRRRIGLLFRPTKS